MTPVDFYFDFASPYGFIAAMQMERLDRPVRWHPFLLGAVYKAVGQSPLDHRFKRDYVITVDAPRMARQIGLQLKVPAGFPEHALPASRLFYWIDERDSVGAVRFATSVYRKYWLHGCATSDVTAAVDVAASIGYDRSMIVAAMNAQATKDRLVAANEDAIRQGVFGSPFFVVDGEPFWGSDRMALIIGRASDATGKRG